MSKPMQALTEAQRETILKRSREAQAFLSSFLYQELKTWISQEQTATTQAIIMDYRGEQYKNLSRDQFVERMCAYHQALDVVRNVFAGFAEQEKELSKLDERSQGTNQG